MNDDSIKPWLQDHSFGQDQRRPGEGRTLLVIALTSIMMVVEIGAGVVFGSMALLADGLHMASHAVALGINAIAYVYARRHAYDSHFSFGVGKINTLGAYTGAIVLAGFALLMVVESIQRLANPVAIVFNQAILVAVLGLLVNGISVLILGVHSHNHSDHQHRPAHSHGDEHHSHDHLHLEQGQHHEPDAHQDHNLLAAYFHVLADALTSLLAIAALLVGKYSGATWLDPVMGIVGALLIAHWSWGLLKTTSAVLLDKEANDAVNAQVKAALEHAGHVRVLCVHYWALGPNIYALSLSLLAYEPQSPRYYKALLDPHLKVDHVTVEVHPYDEKVP